MAVNWDEIRTAYVTGTDGLRAISKAFCVPISTIGKRSRDENWVELRRKHLDTVSTEVHARIAESQVADQTRLYDAARAAIEKMIAVANRVSDDPEGFFRHAVQREQSTGDSKDKWVEDQVLQTINGKNYSDVAKGLTAITSMARILDRIVEAPTQAKLEIDREKLELDKRRAGMGDDIESESGIAVMPEVDETILDTAIPDPEQPQDGA